MDILEARALRTVTVFEEDVASVNEALSKLMKKARKYGNDDIAIVASAPYVLEKKTLNLWGEIEVTKLNLVDLTVVGEAPKIGNHEFLAKIELVNGMALVDTIPGAQVETKFRNAKMDCEHCKINRQRNEVFVILNRDTGEQHQVGRTCLRDYMGIDDPMNIVAKFDFLREFEGLGNADFDEDRPRGSSRWFESLDSMVELAAVCVRKFGWCSKGQAYDDSSLTATAEYVRIAFDPYNEDEKMLSREILKARQDGDREYAQKVIEYIRNVMGDKSDYEHNLKVLFASDTVYDKKRIGLVVSAVPAYARYIEAEIKRTKEFETGEVKVSKAVGEIKERLVDMPVTITLQKTIESNFGSLVLIKFEDEEGNSFAWFTSDATGKQVGDKILLTGTVKNHNEYNGKIETQLSRCKVKEI